MNLNIISFKIEQYSCVDGRHFIHSSIDGRLGCFHFEAIVTNALMNVTVFNFPDYIPGSGRVCLTFERLFATAAALF